MQYINRSLFFSVVVMLAMPISAFADSWSCTRNDHTREIVIERTGDGPVPCNVVYKKPTEKLESQTLWSAENAEGYCEKKAAAFVDKLVSWEWACNQEVDKKADAADVGNTEAGMSGEGTSGAEKE
jgi:hypothetical protein